MKKKLLLVFSLLLILPLYVKAEAGVNVKTVDATVNKNTINFTGTTQDDSLAVMCKLLNSSDEEIDMLSVEVDNNAFEGTFVATETGTYTVACANYEGGTIVTKNAIVTTMATYTVEFNTNEGSAIAPIQVEHGQTVTEPDDPTKDGKVFGGWYEDSTLLIEFDFSKIITADTTIYAKWTDAEPDTQTQTRVQIIFAGGGSYKVEFNTDDPDNQDPMGVLVTASGNYFVDPDTEVTLTATPSAGQHFAGWFTTHEEEDPDNPGNMIWVEDEILSEDEIYQFTPEGEYINIKPIFEEDAIETYTVEFNTNGGSEIASIQVNPGQTVERPEDPTNGNQTFIGWFADDTLTTEFDFNDPITDNTVIYAKWDPAETPIPDPGEETETKSYTVPDGNDNLISFTEEEGHTFEFSMIDYMTLTTEQLEENSISQEEYNEGLQVITNTVKPFGTLLSFYEITVMDTTGQYPLEITQSENGFAIKIKLTEEMEGYDSYKLIYIKDDFSTETPINLAIVKEGNNTYLTGTLNHLSKYALVASKTETTNTNETTTTNENTSTTSSNSKKSPATSDNIFIWFIVVAISGLGILIGTISSLKTKKVK